MKSKMLIGLLLVLLALIACVNETHAAEAKAYATVLIIIPPDDGINKNAERENKEEVTSAKNAGISAEEENKKK